MRKVNYEKNRKRWLAVVLTGVLLCGTAGCGSSKATSEAACDEGYYDSVSGFANDASKYESFAEEDYAATESVETYDGAVNESPTMTESDNSTADTSRYAQSSKKIIKRYNYSYETEHFDDAYAYLKQQVEKYKGYVSSSDVNGRERRQLYMEARIPADQSDAFVAELGNLGTIVSQSQSSEDVTLQYADTEGRIASLKTEQERLLALLEKADNLESIITLENRLTEVRYQLESFESQKKVYDDLVTYSTINISLSEVRYTVEVDESSILSRISTGLKRSLRDVGNGIVNFIIDLIVALPYLFVWAIGLYIAFLIGRGIIRLIIKSIKKKKEKRLNKKLRKEEELRAKQNDDMQQDQKQEQHKDKK